MAALGALALRPAGLDVRVVRAAPRVLDADDLVPVAFPADAREARDLAVPALVAVRAADAAVLAASAR